MIKTKTSQEITQLAAGGRILATILDDLSALVRPGVHTGEIDARARELVALHGVQAAFLNYAPKGHDPYPAAACVSVNEAVVHGVPGEVVLKEGDVVGLDMGIVYEKRFYLDHARTVAVGTVSDDVAQLLDVTKESLRRAIAAAQLGNTTGDIGAAVEQYIESLPPTSSGERFGIVEELVGHGVGFAVHEDPAVPNYGDPGSGARLVEGLVIAIEPMITLGDPEVTTAGDGWTIVTASGRPAAHEEHTVAITADGPRILTARN